MRSTWVLVVCAASLLAFGQSSNSKVALPCESAFQMLSPRGTHAAIRCKDQSWDIIELQSGKSVHQISGNPGLSAYSFSDDGRWFASGFRDGSIQLLPLNGAAAPVTWHGYDVEIDVVRALPSGLVVVAPHEKSAEVWQLTPTRKVIATLATDFSGLTFACVSPDGRRLATGGGDTVVRIYDTQSWKMLHEFRKFTLEPFAGNFTADGKYLLVGGADNSVTVIDSYSGAEVRKLAGNGDLVAEIFPLGDNAHAIAAQWDADGKNPRYLSVWDLQAGAPRKIDAPQRITGGGVVKGEAWFTSALAKTLEIWKADTVLAGK